jgi:8-hydroxy-5-deazaflavin:NADPH oxidoreductase
MNPVPTGAFFFAAARCIVSSRPKAQSPVRRHTERQQHIMKIAILGTGMVGQSLAAALAQKGHEVTIGTRDVAKSLATSEPNAHGVPAFGVWHKSNTTVKVQTFSEAIAANELLINATSGAIALEILASAKPESLGNKVLIDVANDLDFSKGMPPAVRVTDVAGASVGERIQNAFPKLRVVKSLSTMSAPVMLNPALLPEDSTVFMSGNDADAKATVAKLLTEFGWKDIMDLGDITSARAVEFLLPVWLRAWGVVGKPQFNFKIVR